MRNEIKIVLEKKLIVMKKEGGKKSQAGQVVNNF